MGERCPEMNEIMFIVKKDKPSFKEITSKNQGTNRNLQ
jgi:hypothetical protein